MSAETTAALQGLVDGLKATTWSSWQATASFSPALEAAETAIAVERARGSAMLLLPALQIALAHVRAQAESFRATHAYPDGSMEPDDAAAFAAIDSDIALIELALEAATG